MKFITFKVLKNVTYYRVIKLTYRARKSLSIFDN